MTKFLLVMLLMMSAAIVIGQKSSSAVDARLTGLDTDLEKLLKDWEIAGFAVAVVEKNKLLYSKGFGFRDQENKKPVTPNTLFAIGSCSKAFTSAVLGLLEKEGKLNIDKPAANYIPFLKFYNSDMNEKITMRDMMCHRTGLPRHDFSWYLFNSNSRDSMLMRLQYLEPNAGLREKWQYNNFMFLAQGVIAEKLTGKTWEENIKQRFFDSLGMRRSNFSIEEMVNDTNHSVGYIVEKDSIIKKTDYYHIMGMSPAGSINSSVSEMANWVIAWINGGKYNGKEVLPASYVQDAMSSQMVISGGVPDKENPDIHFSNYGLGWFLASYRGHYRVEHGGNIDGFSASTCFFPSDSIGIIVLTNQNGSIVPFIARNLVADRMLKLSRKDWNDFQLKAVAKAKKERIALEKNKTKTEKTVAPMTHAVKDYEGLYAHPGYGTMDIGSKGDSLFIYLENKTFWMKHSTYDVFDLYDVDKKTGIDTSKGGGTTIQFIINKLGEIEALETELEFGLKAFVFRRSQKEAAVEAASGKK